MRIGAVFPQTEIEADPGAIRAWAEAVEGIGYDHVLVYDHVTAVDPDSHPDWVEQARAAGSVAPRPYDIRDNFHEVMVLLGYLAAVTSLELATGVLVLPQRQAALVAKQAAQVDILCEGRLRLGVGIGWNRIEARSMGREFSDRARRFEEQIGLLRRYWTEETVDFEGTFEWAEGVGLAPPPVQRPIPLWIGAGGHPAALDRVGRLADGWLPVATDPTEAAPHLDVVRAAAADAGRNPGEIGLQARLESAGDGDDDRHSLMAEGWRSLGATHLAVNTMRSGLNGAIEHIGALAGAMEIVGPSSREPGTSSTETHGIPEEG